MRLHLDQDRAANNQKTKFAGPLAQGVSDNQTDFVPLGSFVFFLLFLLFPLGPFVVFLLFLLFPLGPFVIFCSFPLVPSPFSALSPSSLVLLEDRARKWEPPNGAAGEPAPPSEVAGRGSVFV